MNTPQECAFRIMGGYCMASMLNNCKKVCEYAQSHEERGIRIRKAYQKINKLSLQKQTHISKKYYDGTMPWKLI